MSILDKVRSQYETAIQGTSKSSKSPSAGSAGPLHRHSESTGHPSAGSAGPLDSRIRTMAQRWGYTADELSEALAQAPSDPDAWFAWTSRDEEQFGGCITPADFANAYARLRGLE